MTNHADRDYAQEVIERVRDGVTTDSNFLLAFRERYGKEAVEELRGMDATGDDDLFEETLEAWVKTAQDTYNAHVRSRPSQIVVDDITPWRRQESLARYVEHCASDTYQIRSFRKKLLQDKLLSTDEASEFLSSPFAASKRPQLALLRGRESLLKPLKVEHVHREGQLPLRRVLVQGKRKPIPLTVEPLTLTTSRGFVFPGDVVPIEDLRNQRWTPAIKDKSFCSFPHPYRDDHLILAKDRSVLADLFDTSLHRLASFPITPRKALWFILTGEFIPSSPVDTYIESFGHDKFERTKITIEAEAWMSAEEVVKYYRYAQKQILGKVPRSLDTQALDLIDFVHSTKAPTWPGRLRIWNDKQPSRRYAQPGHLQQGYNRAMKRLAGFDT